jgi:uncharacterized membrane protein YphA (DoxX/SURF4 family)
VIGLLAFIQGMLYLSNPGGVTPTTTVLGALMAVSGVMLVLGFLTPAVGIVIGLVMTGTAFSWLPSGTRNLFDGSLPALLAGSVSVAIVLLGPGAFSVDARLFGRREIIIPPFSRPPS